MTDPIGDLPPQAYRKIDDDDDAVFYAPARLVTHIDAAAIAALSAFYRTAIPPGGVILDLMSSWVSHLPPDLTADEIIGHGMNAVELAANPRLSRWFVQDLNRDPVLPLAVGACDAALCCVSVQYLQNPIAVFAEVIRVLRPGAPFIVSFSNRCFPTKAVAVWHGLNDEGRARLVAGYCEGAGFSDARVHVLADGSHGDPLTAVVGIRGEARR